MKATADHSRILVCLACPLFVSGWIGTLSAADSPMTIEHPETHWVEGYIPLIPSIHPPTTHDRGDLIQVWLRIPEDGEIDVRWLPDQERHTLIYPDGTVADRVEYLHTGDSVPNLADYAPFDPAAPGSRSATWTVADVRGTRLADGDQWFHVYRPVDGQPHVPLTGWRWRRGDRDARQRATERLVQHVSSTDSALENEPLSSSGIAALRRLNDCAACHVPDRPRIRIAGGERAVQRATDAMGFIVPNAVLQDDCVIADHRPEDVNVEDEFVTVYCADGKPARLREDEGHDEWFICEDGSQPRGRRDVAAGMAAGHPYTEAVCASRAALFRHMSEAAREAFSASFSVCGIAPAAHAAEREERSKPEE